MFRPTFDCIAWILLFIGGVAVLAIGIRGWILVNELPGNTELGIPYGIIILSGVIAGVWVANSKDKSRKQPVLVEKDDEIASPLDEPSVV